MEPNLMAGIVSHELHDDIRYCHYHLHFFPRRDPNSKNKAFELQTISTLQYIEQPIFSLASFPVTDRFCQMKPVCSGGGGGLKIPQAISYVPYCAKPIFLGGGGARAGCGKGP